MLNDQLPKILVAPPKLYPVIEQFNNYRFFLLEGGRNGGKSQFVARFLLYLGMSHPGLTIVCGREVQLRIEESVYKLLKEIIQEYGLPYKILSDEIRHHSNGSVFTFRGFNKMGEQDIKGLQGVDILWVDEAQTLSLRTMQTIIPTIRKEKAKLFFTMNRWLVSDAVYDDMIGRTDCLHIYITYLDNPFCPLNQIAEADLAKVRNEKDYNYIWLGLPLAQAEDYLFNAHTLHDSYSVVAEGDLYSRARILSIDFAAQGNDSCVATIFDRITNQHWKISTRLPWQDADAMSSVGRIVALMGEHKPDVTIIDIGGAGYVVWCRLVELGLDVQKFDGGSTELVDTIAYANQRAEGYNITNQWFENRWIVMNRKDEIVIKQLEKMKMRYRSNGQRVMQDKVKMKLEIGQSPDDADSLMMAVWGAVKFLGKLAATMATSTPIKRISKSRTSRNR